MATKQKADWKFFACVVAGWAVFLFLGSILLHGTIFAQRGTPGFAAVIAEGVLGGWVGSYVYTVFFRSKDSTDRD